MNNLTVACVELVVQVAVVLVGLEEWGQLVLAVLHLPCLIILCMLIKFFMFNFVSILLNLTVIA